jgi:hypothetical protein
MKQTLSESAAWLMDHLMLGVGVGFKISSIEHRLDAPERRTLYLDHSRLA